MTRRKVVISDDDLLSSIPEDERMKFRLTYEGKLYADSKRDRDTRLSRAKHQHELRKVFHKQLKALWENHKELSRDQAVPKKPGFRNEPDERRLIREVIADEYARLGYRFVPLVGQRNATVCNLDILFLRADPPGSLMHGGDLDNRIKTQIDGLRMTDVASELGGYEKPDDDEDPFFCLLENDKYIAHFAVEADTLFQPIGSTFDRNDVRIVITVQTGVIYTRMDNLDWIGS
jgi:hypothetical protein